MIEYSAETGQAITDADADQPAAATYTELPLSAVVPSLTNPRKTFHTERLTELANSIKASGVHQPILVRPLPGSRLADTFDLHQARFGNKATARPTHEIVTGERRYRASVQAGSATIPALVRALTDAQVLEIQIIENLQRDDLSELEEADGYQALITHSNITADEVGAKIGKSRSYVYGRLKLLDLTPEGRSALGSGTIDASRALLLARIPDPQLQIKALKEISVKDFYGAPAYSHRKAADLIRREYMLGLSDARFKVTDATLVPEAGACRTCSKRTGHDPDLFADVKGADVCTDPPCYHRKQEAHTAQQLKAAHESGQTIIEGREAKALMPYSHSSIDGYLRLDSAQDSPTKDTLRKMLGKQIDQAGIKPTLIANPHKAGDLIAVLPSATVAELLKAKGHTEAAAKVTKDVTQDARQEAAQAKAKLQQDYEQSWRTLLMERTWQAIEAANKGPTPWPELDRYQAEHLAKGYNNDRNKIACKLLGLGKVAPGAGVLDHIKDTPTPQRVLLLLIMIGAVEYRHWLADDANANAGLLLVASHYNVNVDQIKAECKVATKAKAAPAKKAEKALTKHAPLAQPSTLPAATAKPSGKPTKTAPLRKPKMSADEAKSGIAEAMQGLEQAATARPEPVVSKKRTTGADKPGIKYRGPNGETWTGRGLRPRWLAVLVEGGAALESLEVAA